MVPRRRRIVRRTMGKDAVKHSNTLIFNAGPGATPAQDIIFTNASGARTTTGANQSIQDVADTSTQVLLSDIIKYVNICIEAAPRAAVAANVGWLEWAVVWQQERNLSIPSTQTGLRTLGDIATKMYRGDCLFSGCIPVGNVQSIVQEVKLKLPAKSVKIKMASSLSIFYYFRSAISTDTGTDNIRVVSSNIYKVYS